MISCMDCLVTLDKRAAYTNTRWLRSAKPMPEAADDMQVSKLMGLPTTKQTHEIQYGPKSRLFRFIWFFHIRR